MAGVNKVTIIGNLGRDPEVRYAQSGMAICSFTVAVGERKKDGDTWKEHTEWFRVKCFGKTAENCGQYLRKGKQVYVEGRLQQEKYTDKAGLEKLSVEVMAHDVTFLGGGGGEAGSGEKYKPAPKASDAPPSVSDGFDSDIPF